MCRHLLYLGPEITLAGLLTQPAHGLLRQSWAPRDMRGGGTINADGFGVGWYHGQRVVRYRQGRPMWSDESFLSLAPVTSSHAVLAAVRSATVGMTFGEAACAPFTSDGWLFSHNGIVMGWPHSVAKLAERLPVTDLLTLDAPTDSALLWALLRRRLGAGDPPGRALAATVNEVAAVAPGSRLNLLLTNGIVGYASTLGHSLSVRSGDGRVVVSSEPFDYPFDGPSDDSFDDRADWIPVPDGALLTADRAGHSWEEL